MLRAEEYWFWHCSLIRVGVVIRNRLKEGLGSPEGIYRASKEAVVREVGNIRSDRAMVRERGDVGRCGSEGECSYYGRNTAKSIGRTLAEAGVQVISGLARGIDAAGHAGALEAGGKTFGILGCGPDMVYPRENEGLYGMVERAGGLISEYPPGTGPAAWHFPARNRIISGLSDCVAVVEAGVRSGSLITASLALEQGKDIWAAPGRVGDFLSRGTNRLIRDGAMPLTEPEDILGGWNLADKILKIHEKTRLSLDKNAEKVYSYLDSDPKSGEQIRIESGLESEIVAAALVRLELEGLAVQPFRHYYAVKRDKGEQHGEASGYCGIPRKGKDHQEVPGSEL